MITYSEYQGEEVDLNDIISLLSLELSEPYNHFTYRFFLNDWSHLTFMAHDDTIPVGTIVCKQELHKNSLHRGYLAMLSTHPNYRGKGIATTLVHFALAAMLLHPLDEIILETESDNTSALHFYEKLGFIREKKLYRFYLNGKDAYRLVLTVDQSLRDRIKARAGQEWLSKIKRPVIENGNS